MIEYLSQIDESVFLSLHHFHRSPFIDDVMWLISSRWIWIPLYLALLYWIYNRQGWKNALLWTIAIALAVTMADQTCASLIRPIVGRLRPANPENPLSELVNIVKDYRGGSHGFPSCHAANTFALVTVVMLAFHNRQLTLTFLVWAILNCLSRVYLGVHYPGDLIAGAIVGIFAGTICTILGVKICKRFNTCISSEKHYTQFNIPMLTGLCTLAVIFLVSLF